MGRVAVAMPALGFDMETGRVGTWLKAVGDPVANGEALAEIETEKATVDLEAQAGGTLAEIVVDEGAEVPVGTTLAWLEC